MSVDATIPLQQVFVRKVYVGITGLQVRQCIERGVLQLTISNVLTFYFTEPFHTLAHLPQPELGSGLLGAEVDTKAMLLVLVPPALEFAIIGPAVVPVALSFITNELARILISSLE